MKFIFGSALAVASTAMAQVYSPPPYVVSSSTSIAVVSSVSAVVLPVTVTPSASSSISSPPAPTSSGSAVGPPIVTGTVTDEITSTYCHKCDEVYVTVYPVTLVDLCPTGTTQNVYTVTETCTGNSETFTPTTCPPGFTTYVTECEVCAEKTITITAPAPPATTTAAPPPPPPPATNAPPPPPPVQPVGTTYTYPPAATTGPQLVTVNAAAGSDVKFFSVIVGVLGAVFAGMVML